MKTAFKPCWLCGLLLLAGCASGGASRPQPPAAKGDTQSAAEAAVLASVLEQLDVKKSDYKISPTDLLDITIYQNNELNRSVRVSQNGTISFPLVGTVQIGGLGVIQAEDALSKKLSDFVIAPQVTIFIKEYGNKHVYVLGQVSKPGSYELPTESRLTVVEAISMAGGFTPIAAPDRTRVIRSVNGKSETYTVEVSEVTKNGAKEKDITLEPNDVVYVPQSYF